MTRPITRPTTRQPLTPASSAKDPSLPLLTKLPAFESDSSRKQFERPRHHGRRGNAGQRRGSRQVESTSSRGAWRH
jgi:hypothetical protein